MTKTLIITVGTSIFTNIITYIQNQEVNDHLDEYENLINSYQENEGHTGFLSGIWLAKHIEQNKQAYEEIFDELVTEGINFLMSDVKEFPEKMSAELNSIIAYKKSTEKIQKFPKDWVFDLFHTDTYIGKLCANIIELFLRNQEDVKVNLTKIEEFSSDATSMNDKGLLNYARKLFEKLNYYKDKNFEPIIIGTGGYKAQIPYTTLAALIYRASVYYYHQLFEDIIRLPNIPFLFVDTRIISKNIELFNELDYTSIPKEELINRWNEAVDENYIEVLCDEVEVNDLKHYKMSVIGKILKYSYDHPSRKESRINIREVDHLKDDYFFKGKVKKLEKGSTFFLFTTGISLLTQSLNFYRTNRDKLRKNYPLTELINSYDDFCSENEGFQPIGPYALEYLENLNQREKENNRHLLIQELRNFIDISFDKGQMERTSAELNTFGKMIKEGYIENSNVGGSFLVSDTYIGKICGEALSEFLNDTYCGGNELFTCKVVRDLTYDYDTFRLKGISNLIKEVISITVNQKNQVAICTTGGFKAETAYVSMLGMILCKPVFYIHENHRSLIYFPPFPILLNFSRIIRYFDHIFNLQWGVDAQTYNEYKQVWGQENDVDNMELFTEKINDQFFLDTAGKVLLEVILQKTAFRRVNEVIDECLEELVFSEDFEIENPNPIDWNPPAGPPEPSKKKDIAKLREFLNPILTRTYASVEYRLGGLTSHPISIDLSSDRRWPRHLPNFGGGNIKVGFLEAETLFLTVSFHNNVVRDCQEKLEQRLSQEIGDIFINQLAIFNIGHEIGIKLPDNYLNIELLGRFIEIINTNN